MPSAEARPNIRIDPKSVGTQHYFIPERISVEGREESQVVDLVVADVKKGVLRKKERYVQVEISEPGVSAQTLVSRVELIAEAARKGRGVAIDPQSAFFHAPEVLEGQVGFWVNEKSITNLIRRSLGYGSVR